MATFVIERALAIGDNRTLLAFHDQADPGVSFDLEVAVALATVEADNNAALATRLNAAMASKVAALVGSSLDGREVT